MIVDKFGRSEEIAEVANIESFHKLANKVKYITDVTGFLNDYDYLIGSTVRNEISTAMKKLCHDKDSRKAVTTVAICRTI